MHVPLRVTYILFFVLLLYSVNSCMKLIHSLLYLMQIDEEILQEVVKMGFDRNLLVESLRNRVQNDVYHSWPFKLLVSFLSSRSQKKKKLINFPILLSEFLQNISGYRCILFAIGQPFPCFQWLSWSWVSGIFGVFLSPDLLLLKILIFHLSKKKFFKHYIFGMSM